MVRKIIVGSEQLAEDIFLHNAAALMVNFKMVRKGSFHGVKIDSRGKLCDPNGKIKACWDAISEDLIAVKKVLDSQQATPRTRTLLLLKDDAREQAITLLWIAFKKLIPITKGTSTFGLVGASKLLFSAFPEIVVRG